MRFLDADTTDDEQYAVSSIEEGENLEVERSLE
jgi:hypothetical protein